jgi:hypothetical protein
VFLREQPKILEHQLFRGPSQLKLVRWRKTLRELPQWKTNFDFYVVSFVVVADIHV